MRAVRVAVASVFLTCTGAVWAILTEIVATPAPQSTQVDLKWLSLPSQTYQVLASTNCATWSNVTPAGLTAPHVIGEAWLDDARASAFYRIEILDVDPPEITSCWPHDGALDVSTNASVQIAIADRTGVASNTLALQVGRAGVFTLADPQLAWSNGRLTFTPDLPLGDAGEIVLSSLYASDALGYARQHDWSFQLAYQPAVTNTFLLLDGTNLTTQWATSNQLAFAYAAAQPAVPPGGLLANAKELGPLYREIVTVIDIDSTNSIIAVGTVDAALPQFIQSGSCSGADFTNLHIVSSSDLAGQPLISDTNVTGHLRSGEWELDLSLDLACLLDQHALQTFSLAATGSLRVSLSPEVTYSNACVTNASSAVFHQAFTQYTQLGGVPVWLRVEVDALLGGSFQSDGTGTVSFSTVTEETLSAGVDLRSYNWEPHVQVLLGDAQCESMASSLTTNHSTTVFLEPRITIEIYGLAGATLLLRSEAEAYQAMIGMPAESVLALRHGLTSTISPTSETWLAEWGASPPSTQRQESWALGGVAASELPPSFVDIGSNITIEVGTPFVMNARVQGAFPASYQWFFNGERIPFTSGPAFAVAAAKPGHEGLWRVEARNAQGIAEATFNVSVLEASIPPAPTMQMVAAGTNSVNDPDFGSYEIAVDAFYMDQREVSKAEWDHVYTWATRYGYSFETAGAGKDAVHPVHSVTWHACVKWCNARSEMEGKVPYYRLADGSIYRSGTIDPDAALSANGYRLPTHDEWEFAARAGASSNRFPWGATITHAEANYYSFDGLPYDLSPTRGYHPSFSLSTPFTAPTDSGATNAYGFAGLVGNVWEWCDDQAAGQRAIRGGSWYSSAAYGRCGDRRWEIPTQTYDDYGFRSVRRTP